MTKDLHHHFDALWARASNLPNLANLSASSVRRWAEGRGLLVDESVERDVGPFVPTPSVVLVTEGGTACFPKVAVADASLVARRNAAERRAALWDSVEWFEPLWVPRGKVDALLDELGKQPGSRALDIFGYHASTIYTLPFQAVCVAQLLPNCRTVADFVPLVREAFLAFYAGYRASGIAALVPIVEGALTRFTGKKEAKIPEKVDKAVDGAVSRAAESYFDGMWAPDEYKTSDYLWGLCERVTVFESFRRWLSGSFFRKTDDYAGATWLNRHLFAHGLSADWQRSANFKRLIVALTTLGVIEAWHDGSNTISLLFPEMNDDAKLLWEQAMVRMNVQLALKDAQAERYQKHGRLAPELPTDDGATLRRVELSQACVGDLMRPLREAGWSVEMDDVEETGLFVTLRATAGDESFGLALLYSCATGNSVYKKLEEEVSVILYCGAPYHQKQYAYGIAAHVGPVAGWQPPRPKER